MDSKFATEVSKEELQKLAIVGTHLHRWQGEGDEGIKKVFEEQATVQLDPLNPAGRNHDMFFASRVKNYKINRFQQIVYPEKIVFESYFPNLKAIYKTHFPLFLPHMKKEFLHRYYQTRIEKLEKEHKGFLNKAREYLASNGPSRAADLSELAKTKPEFSFWKTSNLAGMALEVLWLLGDAVIVNRDENWRKTYGLTAEYFSESFLKQANLDTDEINYQKFLLRQKSYPLINLGKVSISKKNKLILGKKKRLSPKWFEEEEEDSPQIIKLEDNQTGYAVPSYWREYLKEKIDNDMRAIAPLDPIIWDRELTMKVFDFEYSWEVYKIPKDRIWGYYVYPLLYQGKFFGRLEANFDKKKRILKFFNLQIEGNTEVDNTTHNALHNLFQRWKEMLDAEKVILDKTIV